MSVKSFLKTLGLDALKAAQLGTEIIPILKPFSVLIPKVGDKVVAVEDAILPKLDTMQSLIIAVQKTEIQAALLTNGATGLGAAKAQLASLSANLPEELQAMELLGGKLLGEKFNKLNDDQKRAFNLQCGKIAGDVADLLNLLEP